MKKLETARTNKLVDGVMNDIVCQSNFDIAFAVSKYEYTDMSHMMREFKRHHTMNIREAREMALK